MAQEERYRVGILTISDSSSQGKREDTSGPEIRRLIEEGPFRVVAYEVVPDNLSAISARLIDFVDRMGLDLVLTTGGTGVSPRDLTPEATEEVIERTVPGMAEAMRAHSTNLTPRGMISRGIVGIRKSSLIVNLPGSPRGARQNLQVIMPALPHALSKIKGSEEECGRDSNHLEAV